MKSLIIKFGSTIAGLALMITAMNVNSTCSFWAHQPELPVGAWKLRREL